MDKHKPWFRYVRSSYLPYTWQGYLMYFVYLFYILILPIDWYIRGHKIWILLTEVIPLMVLSLILTQIIASKNSDKKN